jgi:hypothetical protein
VLRKATLVDTATMSFAIAIPFVICSLLIPKLRLNGPAQLMVSSALSGLSALILTSLGRHSVITCTVSLCFFGLGAGTGISTPFYTLALNDKSEPTVSKQSRMWLGEATSIAIAQAVFQTSVRRAMPFDASMPHNFLPGNATASATAELVKVYEEALNETLRIVGYSCGFIVLFVLVACVSRRYLSVALFVRIWGDMEWSFSRRDYPRRSSGLSRSRGTREFLSTYLGMSLSTLLGLGRARPYTSLSNSEDIETYGYE